MLDFALCWRTDNAGRCLAPFDCHNGRLVGQGVSYGCKCSTDGMAPAACQACSFRADEFGTHCTRCLGGTYLQPDNRCHANCSGLTGLIAYAAGNCEIASPRHRQGRSPTLSPTSIHPSTSAWRCGWPLAFGGHPCTGSFVLNLFCPSRRRLGTRRWVEPFPIVTLQTVESAALRSRARTGRTALAPPASARAPWAGMTAPAVTTAPAAWHVRAARTPSFSSSGVASTSAALVAPWAPRSMAVCARETSRASLVVMARPCTKTAFSGWGEELRMRSR